MDKPWFSDEVEPIEPQALYEAMEIMSALARAGKRLPPLPDEPTDLEDDQRELYRAVRAWFPDTRPEWIFSLTWRLIALSDLVGSGALEEWVIVEENGGVMMPDVVVEVAAGFNLRRGRGFDGAAFLAALDERPVHLTGE